MITMIHKTTVADYEAWKKEFEAADPVEAHTHVRHLL